MAKVAIVSDSTMTVPDNLLSELNIHMVPYFIHRGSEVLRDLVTIDRDTFYRWLPTAKQVPQTASPGSGEYLEMYQDLSDDGVEEIVSIHMSSKVSGAYQAALVAKGMVAEVLPKLKVEVIDTLNASMCHGWMVIEAARAALAGSPIGEIVATVKALMPITRMLQTADTLRYLYLGGRIGKAKHLVGSLLNIKPIIGIEDGVIVPLGTARSRSQAYQMMVGMVEKVVGSGKVKIAYVHAAALEEVQKIKEMVEARLNVAEYLFAELPPSLGVHTGPGTAGLCYFPVI